MTVQTQVLYPSTSAFSGTGQLNLGPFNVLFVKTLLRVEVRGKANFQGISLTATSVEANFQLWALQWVTAGSPPPDCVTTPDGPNWLIREQVGRDESRITWAPSSATGVSLIGLPLVGRWAGQLAIGASIDFWLSMRAPTGASMPDFNVFASLRFWWT